MNKPPHPDCPAPELMARFEEWAKAQEERYHRVDETLSSLDTALRGNGSPGIGNRLSHLERTVGNVTKAAWVAMGAVIVASVSWIWDRVIG